MTYAAEVTADSPSAWFRLNEASGAVIDQMSIFTGTVNGTATRQAPGIPGDTDTALDLDGSTGYVDVGDNVGLSLADGPFTLECWVKRHVGTAVALAGLIDKQNTAYQLYIGGSSSSRPNKVVLDSAGSAVCMSTATLTDTLWHHIVATYNGGTTGIIYVDGVAGTTQIGTNVYTNNVSQLWIGQFQASAGFLDGTIDEVALYKSVLSAARVLAHYTAGAPAPGAPLHRLLYGM